METNWDVSLCTIKNPIEQTEKDCTPENWISLERGEEAVYEHTLSKSIQDIIDMNPDENILYFVRLKVWNPGEEKKALTSYGSVHYL